MCITVTVLGVGLYLNSLGNDFTFDDPYAVKKNKEARWNADWSTLITHEGLDRTGCALPRTNFRGGGGKSKLSVNFTTFSLGVSVSKS